MNVAILKITMNYLFNRNYTRFSYVYKSHTNAQMLIVIIFLYLIWTYHI